MRVLAGVGLKSVLRKLFIVSCLTLVIILVGGGETVSRAQSEEAPFGLPFLDPPGPDTWLMVQAYGNTTGE